MESLEGRIHTLRQQIDAAIKAVGELKNEPNKEQLFFDQGKVQREVALTYTKLQEAKMWLGKCLEELGSELPAQYRDEAK